MYDSKGLIIPNLIFFSKELIDDIMQYFTDRLEDD
jgi:hypothetical protein